MTLIVSNVIVEHIIVMAAPNSSFDIKLRIIHEAAALIITAITVGIKIRRHNDFMLNSGIRRHTITIIAPTFRATIIRVTM